MNKEKEKISYGVICRDFDIINRPKVKKDEEDLDILESVYQTYIIGQQDAGYLCRWTDQLVGYNPVLDVFVWHITHFGTSWDYVFTEKYINSKDVDLSELTKHMIE